jgi:hypothetical protein
MKRTNKEMFNQFETYYLASRIPKNKMSYAEGGT